MKDLEFLESLPNFLRRMLQSLARYPSRIMTSDKRIFHLTDRQKIAYWWTPNSPVLLDIGSSDSQLSMILRDKANSVFVIDQDVDALVRLRTTHTDVCATKGLAEYLPFPANSIDTILFLDVLEHTSNNAVVLNEIVRILKAKGNLILSVPNRGLFSFLDPQNLGSHWKGSISKHSKHRHYSESEIMNLLANRFRLVRKHTGGLFLYPVTFYLTYALRKYFNIEAGSIFRSIGDWDNDVSWGKFSYNLILQFEKL